MPSDLSTFVPGNTVHVREAIDDESSANPEIIVTDRGDLAM